MQFNFSEKKFPSLKYPISNKISSFVSLFDLTTVEIANIKPKVHPDPITAKGRGKKLFILYNYRI